MNAWIENRRIRRLLDFVVLALTAAMVGSAPAQIQQVWTRNFAGSFAGTTSSQPGPVPGLALDGQTNLCLTGTAESDFLTVKYSPEGNLIWSNRFDGGAMERAEALAADAAGQVWVSGTSEISGDSQTSALVIKYDATGSLSWTQQFHSNVLSAVVVVDNSGNPYLGGALSGGFLYVVKYSVDGNQLWARVYQAAPDSNMTLRGLAIDHFGNIALAGFSTEFVTFSKQSVLVKFDAAGNLLYANDSLPFPDNGTLSAMTLDPDGNAYLSGNSVLAMKVGLDGGLHWTIPRNGSQPNFSTVQIDPAGNLVVAGTDIFYQTLCSDCGDSETRYHLHRTKLSPGGDVLWSERSYKDFGFGRMQFDADGSCYLGGTFSTRSDDPLPAHPDTILVKHAPNGSELWRASFTTGSMAGLKVDGAGNIYLVTGGIESATIRKFVQPQSAPVFRSHPVSRTILDGDDVIFSVSGSGFPSPTFQWRFNEVALPGETNDTLMLVGAHTNHAGNYSVVLSNSLGSVTSLVAKLTVNFAVPIVTAQFITGDTQVLAGTTFTICAEATGGPKPTLQWLFNGASLPGETNSCLTLGPLQLNQSGTYSIVASNDLGTASASLNLNVRPLTIFYEGRTFAAYVGSCLYLDSTVGIAPPYSFQWLRNGQPIPNEINPWLYRCFQNTNEAGLYALVVSDTSGSYTSAPVEVILYYERPTSAEPVFSLGQEDAFVEEDVVLAATHYGSPSFIQWRFNGSDLPGETNRTLPLLAIAPQQAGEYSFVATNIAGAITSSVRTITVSYQAPTFVMLPSNFSVVEGTTARFAALARGGPPPVLFLERDGTNVAVPVTYAECCGPAQVGFSLLDTTLADAGAYRIIASNSLGRATSDVVVLNVTIAGPLDRWTQRNPLPQSQSILAMAHGTNQFVAVGERGTIMTSADGANWTVQNRRADVAIEGVAYGQGQFVAVGDGGTVLSSSDGTNWAYRYTAASIRLNAVAYGSGRFVAVGTLPGVTTLILTSTNGIDWERIPLNGPEAEKCIAYGNELFVAAGDSSIIISTNGRDWSVARNVSTEVESVTYANGSYVAVGDDGLILVSTDGLSWGEHSSGTERRLLGVTYGAGRFVAAGARGVMITSTDTVTWDAVTSGTPDRMETADFFGETFVSAGENGTILTSTDGITWTKQNFGVTRDLDGMAVANGTIVVVGKGGTILTSTNGVNYTTQNAGLTNDLHGVFWGDGLWVAVGEPGIILTSTNAMNWTSRSSGTTNALKDGTYADGQWIVVGRGGSVVRSTDGVNWAVTYTSPPFTLNDVAYGNGMFLVAGDGQFNQNGSVFKSVDGVAWTYVNFNPSKNLRGVTFANDQFLFAANDSFILSSSNGVNFLHRNIAFEISAGANLRAVDWVNGLWIVVGNDGAIATSPDAITWTARPSRAVENLHQVAWLDGRFITIGNRGTILQSGLLDSGLEPPRYVPGVGFRIPFQGELSRIYQIEASTNLVNWVNLLTFTNQTERGEFTDTNALHFPWRFYRFSEP